MSVTRAQWKKTNRYVRNGRYDRFTFADIDAVNDEWDDIDRAIVQAADAWRSATRFTDDKRTTERLRDAVDRRHAFMLASIAAGKASLPHDPSGIDDDGGTP